MKQPYVSTLIEQDFTSAEKALGRHNIDAISSADLEGYATQEWVQDQNYITSADLPDVSDMATKTWTSENFYPDTNPSGFITSSDVPRYREGDYISIDPISLAISVTGINPDDYLTSADMDQYATHEEVESATSGKMDSSEASAFYPRYENPEGYLTSGDLPDFHVYSAGQYVNIEGDTINVTGVYPDTNPSGFATSSWVIEQNYITSADVPAAQEYSAGQYVSITDHVVSVTGLQPEGDYLTRSEASAYLTSADLPDLTNYVTSADVSGFVDVNYVENNFYSASNPSGFLTSADIPQIQQVQSDWAEDDDSDPSYIQNKPGPVALEALSPLYIIDETSASKIGIYTSAIPELSGYVTKSYVDQTFYSAANPSGFITSADLPDLSEYATTQYVENSITSATSGKQDSLVFGYTDNKISSINSSAIYGTGGSFTQEQADWAENDNTQVDYIKNKPTPVGLKAGYGIRLTDETSAVKIESNIWAPTVECHAMSVSDAGYVNVIYPQSSACVELHVTTPKNYSGAESYSARINDEYTYVIPSGCWYDFVKQDDGNSMEWWLKDSGTFF